MKLKVKSGRRGTKLTGESVAGEEFVYAEAECVRAGCDETLLTFSYEQKKRGYTFDYYVGTACPIGDIMRDVLPREYYESMLVSFLRLAQACDNNGLSMQRVSLEPETILFDPARYVLRFAYMPVRGTTEHISSALQAIEYISENFEFGDDDTQELADKVLDYVRRAPIFSWIEYEAFLKEIGVLEGKTASTSRNASYSEDRQTSRIDCRDTFGYDFVSQAAEIPSEQQVVEKPNVIAAGEYHFSLVRLLDGMEWDIPEGVSKIGSLQECDICLSDVNGVSRTHATFTVIGDNCTIEDNDSTNGTSVNGRRIAPKTPVDMKPGDRILIARTQFELKGKR